MGKGRFQSIILGSGSPRRRELLAELGIPFEVRAAEVDELDDPRADPEFLVRENARRKGEWLSRLLPGEPILTADTTVSLEGWILNKPSDLAQARQMLQMLSGRVHRVFTALRLVVGRGGDEAFAGEACVVSEVRFHRLDHSAIERYLSDVEVLDKAGAYAIQEAGASIVAGWTGSFSNIMGLPLAAAAQLLKEAGAASVAPPPDECLVAQRNLGPLKETPMG